MTIPAAPPPPTGALRLPQREGAALARGHRLQGRAAFFPPPGRRRTPDHPPYAEMIQVALRALAEEGGSTAAAISRRIATVYLDLPWAHERLLPYYLRRLVAAGDVFVASPGRYVHSHSPAPAGDVNPNPAPDPSSNPTSFTVHYDGPAAGCAAATPRSSSSSAAPAELLDNGAGERVGARTWPIPAAAATSGVDGESHCDHSLIPAMAVCLGGDDRRPSLPDPTSADAFVVRKEKIPLEHNRPSSTICIHHTCFLESESSGRSRRRPPLGKRKRGRPSMRCHCKMALSTPVSDPGVGEILPSTCGKCRPPNSSILSRHGQESVPIVNPSVLPRRRRGRPPKCRPADVTSDAISAINDVNMLNFASLQHHENMELDGSAYSYWSLGDGGGSAGEKGLSNCSVVTKPRLILRLSRRPEPVLAIDSLTSQLSELAQATVHVPKCRRSSIAHKPKKPSTTLFEERVSNGSLCQSSEQASLALPASIQDNSLNNIMSSRPQINGWVQVLLAVKPKAAIVCPAKDKKSRWRCSERDRVRTTKQFRSDSFVLSREVKNVTEVDACPQGFVVNHSYTHAFLQTKENGNGAHMEECIQLIPAVNSDPNILLEAMEEENGVHDIEGSQALPVGHSVLDGSLHSGKEGGWVLAGGHIDLLPSEQFTVDFSLQTSLDNVAHTEGSLRPFVAGLSKPEDGLQIENIELHTEVCASEGPLKQLLNHAVEDNSQSGGFIQELPVDQSRPEDGLQTEQVNESNSKICLQVLGKSGDDLQIEENKRPLGEACGRGCPAEQYIVPSQSQELEERPRLKEFVEENHAQYAKTLDDIRSQKMNESHSKDFVQVFQGQESDNMRQVGEFVKEPHTQYSKTLDELQSEKRNEPHAEDCGQVLTLEQVNLKDDFPLEKKNGTHATGHMMAFSATHAVIHDSSWGHEPRERSHDELFNQGLHAEQKKPTAESRTGDIGQLHAEKCVQVLQQRQSNHGVDLSSEADESRRYANKCVLALRQNGPQNEEFTHEIPIEQCSGEDDLQTEYVESHAEGMQVSAQEQRKFGDNMATEADKSRAHAEELVLQFPLKTSLLGDSEQAYEPDDKTQSGELTQELPSKQSKLECSFQMDDTNKLRVDGYFKGRSTELSDDPTQQQEGEKFVLLKKGKKRSRRLWFEG